MLATNGLIELNAAANPGNNGVPVSDMQGRGVGIATIEVQQTPDGKSVDGLGIAIPIGYSTRDERHHARRRGGDNKEAARVVGITAQVQYVSYAPFG